MSRLRNLFSVYLLAGLILCGFAGAVEAQKTRNEKDVRSILRSLDSKMEDFRDSLSYGLRNSSANRRDDSQMENYVETLNGKIREFEDNFSQRRENSRDINDILYAAKGINDYLSTNRVNNTVQKDWSDIRGLLDRLASSYNVSWNWQNGTSTNNYPNSNFPTNSPTNSSSSNSYGLTGTYELDTSRSENVQDIVAKSDARTDDQREDLENKLEAAEQLAIEVRGNQITLASSEASPITFSADGRTRTENQNGKTIRVRATLRGQELTVSSLGGETDYTVTFASSDNGKSLKVTRRITTDYLRQTIFAESFYNKTDSVARFDGTDNNTNSNNDNGTYSSNDPNDNPNNNPNSNNPNSNYPNSNYPTTTNTRTGDFIVPNGTMVTGILDNDVNTKISQNNDRFRLIVQSPDEYRGAVIEGYLSGINRSGKVSGRSQITFNFERITLRNGQTYEFAGYLQSITDTNGKTIKIDTEGTAKGDSQTKETAKRGGIGAGAGAIIGAIIGGVKGAAIGAIIGGGAGAGSVIVQGKDDLELKKGSSMTIQSSAPNR